MIREYCDMCNKEVPTHPCKEKSGILFQEYMNQRQMVLCKDCYDEIVKTVGFMIQNKRSPFPRPIPMTRE